jgi:hypothetical protein
MILTQFALRSGWIAGGLAGNIVLLFGTVFFMIANYLVLLNNRWLKRLNNNLAHISKHNMNAISVVVLINVIIICSFMLFTAR